MAIRARSQEEIEHLSKLNTVTLTICRAGITKKRYYIVIGESVSKFGPCYLNKNCEIVTQFNSSEYMESYAECLDVIRKEYEISDKIKTPYHYVGIEATEE